MRPREGCRPPTREARRDDRRDGLGVLHKLRAGMVASARTQIGGAYPVEIDEAEFGSPPRGRKESPEKIIVVGAVERRLIATTWSLTASSA